VNDVQNGQRRRFSAQETVAILRQDFIEKAPVSEVWDKHGLNPTVFCRRQEEFIAPCGMTHMRTSPYYPQSNSKLERFHPTARSRPMASAPARR